MKVNRCLKFKRTIFGKPTGCAIGNIFKCISVNIMDKRFADYNFSCVMTGDQTLPAKVHITLVNVHVYFKLNGIYQSSEIVCWYDEKEETLFIDLDKFVNPAIWN